MKPSLRVVHPGESRPDPHAATIERTAYLRQLLRDMMLCTHRPLEVIGCRGCAAWQEARTVKGAWDV